MRFNAVLFLQLIFAVIPLAAQSSNVELPTPITSDTISGKIKARDLGDPRSTVYYFAFEATQGDVFIKIQADNLNGDIDIFYADNLRPLTKVSLYADSSPILVSREIYLRKSEKLILKVEGRTPNDDPATFSIKFEGSFVAMSPVKTTEETKAPHIKSATEKNAEIKVNSVGTIIEAKPKPTPTSKPTVARANRGRNTDSPAKTEAVSTVKTPTTTAKEEVKTEPKPEPEIVATKPEEKFVTENLPKPEESTEKPKESKEPKEVEIREEKPKAPATKPTRRTDAAKKPPASKPETQPKSKKPTRAEELANALENVRLVVEFRDGAKIERPMNDVVRFGVEKGFLTIVNKDGSVGKYSILEIAKISVE